MRSPSDVGNIARELRRNTTVAEQLLWARLRGRALAGFKFRRQHAKGRFVLDFYCPEARLALELDGAHHHEPERLHHDTSRAEELARAQIRVLRFRNHDVLRDIDQVCNDIREALLLPLPRVGEGRGEGTTR